MFNITEQIKDISPALQRLTKQMYDKPELGHEEVYASEIICELLTEKGFTVEKPFCGMQTAFKAAYTSKKQGPVIAFLAEYDALPEIGHGCGHNILGATSVGASIVLKNIIDDIGGTVVLYGTPAEETDGGKVAIAKSGEFANVDIAMMAHPSGTYEKSGASNSLMPLRFEFFGKTAHAAGDPEEGINALNACISLFNNVNAIREHIRRDSRIHGIITNGGTAANIVPEYASADFYVRSSTMSYQRELIQKVKNCAEAAALSNGATVKISQFEADYDTMVTNETLSNLFWDKMNTLGITPINPDAKNSAGGTDAGNVSLCCPMIHEYFSVKEDGNLCGHSREFADCTITNFAFEQMEKTIEGFILTSIDVITKPELLTAIKEEFKNSIKL